MALFGCYKLSSIQQRNVLTPRLRAPQRPEDGAPTVHLRELLRAEIETVGLHSKQAGCKEAISCKTCVGRQNMPL
jgi:hypothetical protein